MKVKPFFLILATMLALSACSPDHTPSRAELSDKVSQDVEMKGEDLAFGKYKVPITLRIGFSIPNEAGRLAQGDTYDDNPWSRYFQSKTGIQVVHSWQVRNEGDAYRYKLNVSIADNDLPDAMVVDRQQLRALVDRDMLADMTEVFPKYASPLVKAMYDSSQGLATREATFGGKLMALPNIAIEADSPTLVWVRQDWLDKLKLPAPTTLNDIATIAKAFIEQDPDGNGKPDTVGIPVNKVIVWGAKPNINGLDSVFGAYRSFPGNWLNDRKGNIYYGSIAPETKQALGKLAQWYKDSIIDPEFVLRQDPNELIADNKAGIFFGPWYAPSGPLRESVKKDMAAEWKAFAAPLDTNGKFVTHMAPITDRYLVVRKGYPNPEAVVRLLNQFTQYERVDIYIANYGSDMDPALQALKTYKEANHVQPRHYYPFDLLLDYTDSVQRSYKAVLEVMEGRNQLDKLAPQYQSSYKNMIIDREHPKKNLDAWVSAHARAYGAKVIVDTPMDKVYSEFYGLTTTMETRWAALEKLEKETFLRIINGSAPLDSFDSFVQQWNQLGGETITKEIQKSVDR